MMTIFVFLLKPSDDATSCLSTAVHDQDDVGVTDCRAERGQEDTA
jgi:hypothetical protein